MAAISHRSQCIELNTFKNITGNMAAILLPPQNINSTLLCYILIANSSIACFL